MHFELFSSVALPLLPHLSPVKGEINNTTQHLKFQPSPVLSRATYTALLSWQSTGECSPHSLREMDCRKEQLWKTRQKGLQCNQWESTTIANGKWMVPSYPTSKPYANFQQHSKCTSQLSKCFLFLAAQHPQLFSIRSCLFS